MPAIHSENPYLIDDTGVDYEIDPHKRFTVPAPNKGSQPTDGGNLILSPVERDELIKKYPQAEKFIRRYVGAEEFIFNKPRYCLWLVNCSPNEIKAIPPIYERIKKVREFRSQSKKQHTKIRAGTPTLFTKINQPTTNFILIPSVSTSARKYIPMGFMTPEVIVANTVIIIPEATIYLFGVLESSVHMAWMRAVCGRLGHAYRYSGDIVYNNFIFINADAKRRAKIEATAQTILDARAKYPNSSLADLYDENVMPPELRAAHRANDMAVMDAYGYPKDWYDDERKIVIDLFQRYEAMLNGNDLSKIAATTRRNIKE